MTKYQIISPNGVKVCIIEADYIEDGVPSKPILFIKYITENKSEVAAKIPAGWVAIPLDAIVKSETNFDSTIAYLKNGYLYYKFKIDELAKSSDILDAELMKKLHGEMEEFVRAIRFLEGKDD